MGFRECALEGLVSLALFGGEYCGRKVLVTGHTGFKGSWLVLWLQMLGAEVSGIALDPPDSPNHWDLLDLDIDEYRQDICDAEAVQRIIAKVKPEIVFHLAAQALVRKSYLDPLSTWATNVQGTANILEACRHTASVKAAVVVTSDKCYEQVDLQRGFREDDQLGGYDPYSASKAASELVVSSFRRSFCTGPDRLLLASARAGNVIGGGDWSEDRLIPDLMRAVSEGRSMEVRFPHAIRSWQHVLDALSGYLLLGQQLLAGKRDCASAWNFGPAADDDAEVCDVLLAIQQVWPAVQWQQGNRQEPHESACLRLDSAKARQQLGWEPVWQLEDSIIQCAHWYQDYLNGEDGISHKQLKKYLKDAGQIKCDEVVV